MDYSGSGMSVGESSMSDMDLPTCTCPSYQSGAVDGTEMCQFGDNCSLGTNFGDNGCPPNAVHCVMDIAESSDDSMSMDYSMSKDSMSMDYSDSMSMDDLPVCTCPSYQTGAV